MKGMKPVEVMIVGILCLTILGLIGAVLLPSLLPVPMCQEIVRGVYFAVGDPTVEIELSFDHKNIFEQQIFGCEESVFIDGVHYRLKDGTCRVVQVCG